MVEKPIKEADLHAYVDGQLDPDRAAQVAAYLETHPAELQRVRSYAEQKRRIRSAFSPTDSSVEPMSLGPLTETLHRKLRRRLSWSWVSRAATVFLLVGAGWLGNQLYTELLERRVPEYVEEAAGAHMVYAADAFRPVELTAAAKDTMLQWFTSKLGVNVPIPDLSRLGLELLGGRLLGTKEGPIAYLLYKDRAGGRLTVSIWPKREEIDEVDETLTVTDLEGMTVGYWSDDDLAYALIVSSGTAQLGIIASEMAERNDGRL